MKTTAEIVSSVHPNFTPQSFPLGFDRNGILRYRNVPGGTYANAAAHGIVVDCLRQQYPQTFSVPVQVQCSTTSSTSELGISEPIDLSDKEDSDGEDFVEASDYELEVYYSRAIRLHGEDKKTKCRVVVHRKPVQKMNQLKTCKKEKQRVHRKHRQNKMEKLDILEQKCQSLDAIWIKHHGWTHDANLSGEYNTDYDDPFFKRYGRFNCGCYHCYQQCIYFTDEEIIRMKFLN
ncbi:hypothetical protein [Moumouvirus maliensis]|nr:hypothetical protein [Moumouvirus maliensis]